MKITWFGHSAFRLDFASNVVLIDPFFTGNPAFQGSVEQASEGVTHILITHGHADHIGDAPAIAQQTGAKVITNYDLCMYLAKQGLTNLDPMNTGGTTEQDGFTTTLVRADHSSGLVEMDVHYPLGSANGFILSMEGGPTVYHMGDTDIFGDMALIQELYEPDVIFIPIGGRFTMGPKTAALALKRFFKPKAVFPCHYGSFSLIESNADNFIEAMDGSGIQVVIPQKGLGVRI